MCLTRLSGRSSEIIQLNFLAHYLAESQPQSIPAAFVSTLFIITKGWLEDSLGQVVRITFIFYRSEEVCCACWGSVSANILR
jgi:hypothetical protein